VLEATARRGPSALKFHNARLFVAGQGLSNIGTFSQIVALSLLVLQLTDSGLALGALIVGAAIDRWSPRAAIGLGASTAVVAGLALLVIAARSRSTSRFPDPLNKP